MYCDFNPRLFKQFTSKKTKIIPAMADDWEIIPATYVKLGGFSLKSVKLNQEVADIPLLKFLKFCKEYNLTINGLKLDGNFIIGNDRAVYTADMFTEWRTKFESRTETIIEKKDYIVGHKYKTPCGAEVIYGGSRYVSSVKAGAKDGKNPYDVFSKVVLKHYTVSKSYGNTSVYPLSQKFTVDLGEDMTLTEVDSALKKYSYEHAEFGCFQKTKPKAKSGEESYVLEEIDISDLPKINSNYNNKGILFIEDSDGNLRCSAYSYRMGINIHYENKWKPESTNVLTENYEVDFHKSQGRWGRRENITIAKCYKWAIVD